MKLTRCLLCFLWPLFEGSSVLYGQTVTEALDTPGIGWVITGSAQPLADSLLSHDGVDFLKLSHLPGVPSKVSAQFPSPSEVKFWHRSADPARVSFFRVGDLAGPSLPVSSTDWQEHRLVVLPGTFALEFAGTSVAPAIHLDQLSLTALTEIGLSEALDAPGLSFSRAGSNRLPAGLAVSGVTAEADAVYFPDSGSSSVTTTVTGPAVLKYRYFPVPASEHPLQPPVFGAQKPDSSPLHQWRLGGTGLVCVPGGSQAVELYRSGGTVDVSSVILDQVEVLPMLSLSEALDAPELTFTTTNATDDAGPRIAPVAAGPPEANGGDALLLIGSFSGNPPAVKTSLTGPGILTWNRLGLGVVEVDGLPMIPTDVAAVWTQTTIQIPVGTHVVSWRPLNISSWLDKVRFIPGSDNAPLAAVLDNPGGQLYFSSNAATSVVAGAVPGTSALELRANIGFTPPEMVLVCGGPCVMSLALGFSGNNHFAREFKVNGGPHCGYTSDFGSGWQKFAVLIPYAGPQTVTVNAGAYDEWQVIPLEEVPLTEALDVPGMVFRTSPDTPWKGFKTTTGMNRRGNDAACGGVHDTTANPWLETDITGPATLRFRLHCGARTGSVSKDSASVTLDGQEAGFTYLENGQLRQMAIPAGKHTVRWTQDGSQVLTHPSSLVWLDDIIVQPTGPATLAEACETEGVTWTTGGAGSVVPTASTEAPDKVDAVILGSGGWMETTVALPSQLQITATNITASSSTGWSQVVANQSVNTNSFDIPGTGATTLRLTAIEGRSGVVDQVGIFEQVAGGTVAEVMGVQGAEWISTGPVPWTFLRSAVSGKLRMQARGMPLQESMWLETTLSGPFVIKPVLFNGTDEITLPDQQNRIISPNGQFPFSSPERLRIRIRHGSQGNNAPITVASAGVTAIPGPGAAAGAPELVWKTSGTLPWMGSTSGPAGALSATGRTGEQSWLEAAIPGPGVLGWKLATISATGTTWENGPCEIFCNDLPVPVSAFAYLHLPSGQNRVRWRATSISIGSVATYVRLSEVSFTPKPTGSVQEILGCPDFVFAQSAYRPDIAFDPLLKWPGQTPWAPAQDSAAGRTTLRNSGGPLLQYEGPLLLLPKVPGIVTARVRADLTQNFDRTGFGFPANTLPFPWMDYAQTAYAARATGWKLGLFPGKALYWLDDVAFTPAPSVGIGEALDQPDLPWATGGTRPELWKGWSGPAATEGTTGDALHCRGLSPGETAWIETPVNGPVNVSWRQNSALSLTMSIDGAPAISREAIFVNGASINLDPLTVYVSAGTHTLRWAVTSPPQPLEIGPTGILDQILITPAAETLDPAPLIDAPSMQWFTANAKLRASAITHDGVDALEITPSGTGKFEFFTGVEGPGVIRLWCRRSSTAASAFVSIDTLLTTIGAFTAPNVWQEIVIPVPKGSHRVALSGFSTTLIVDEVSWQPLPMLALAEAVDAPAGMRVTAAPGAVYGAASWPAFSVTGGDSVLLMPHIDSGMFFHIPPGASLSFRARALGNSATLVYSGNGTRTGLFSNQWTTITARALSGPDLEGISVRPSSTDGPVLIDHATLTSPVPGPYQSWIESSGMSSNPLSGPFEDPDLDGVPNLLEFAFQTPPLSTQPTGPNGIPVVSIAPIAGGGETLAVDFTAVVGAVYNIETTADPHVTQSPENPGGWRAVQTLTVPAPGGYHWQSPLPVLPGQRQFVRIRVTLP